MHKEPVKNTAPLKKRPLPLYNYRKVKFHYRKLKPKEKPAMRIIYGYIEETDTLEFLAIGFRWDEPDDIYDIADLRENKDIVNL